MIAKFYSRQIEYTVDTMDYKEKTIGGFKVRVYKLKRDGYEQSVTAFDTEGLKIKLKRNGFEFIGFVTEGEVQ